MKVLVIASGNSKVISPFISDQVDSLKKEGLELEYFLIKGKGVRGYVNNYFSLRERIKSFRPSVVHAHYGLSGLLASIQRSVPVVVTFHGSDINIKKVRYFSRMAHKMCSASIFVSKDLAGKINASDPVVIPCGVDLDLFSPYDKKKAKSMFEMDPKKKYVLFSSNFNNPVKNYPLAKEATDLVSDYDIELLELKGYSREQVAKLLNAVDAVIMTSFTEGSPQFIKEAMACNTPIVTVNVGDVEEVVNDTEGCYIAENNPEDISLCIKKAISFDGKTEGRKKMDRFDNKKISERIIAVYDSVLN